MLRYLNLIDAIAISLLLLSALIGVVRGFTREVLSILGWSGAAAAAFFSGPLVRPYVLHYVKNSLLAEIIGQAIVFVAALVLLALLNRFFSNTVKGSALGGIDRALGLLFGLMRAGAIIVIAFFGMSLFWKPSKWPMPIRTARITPYALSGAIWLQHWLPRNMIKGMNSNPLKEALNDFQQNMPVETIIENLSQPMPAASQNTPDQSNSTPQSTKKSTEGYSKEQIEGLNNVIKKM